MENFRFRNLLFGKNLRAKMAHGDIEYRRKATLLIILYYLAIVMLGAFACLSLGRGDPIHAAINAATLFLALIGFFVMRLSGNLTAGAYIIISLLSMQFLSDFRTDTYRAMWSFTIPVVCFFMLGIRGGITVISIYWALVVLSLFFTNAKNYPLDFKIRFFAIYFCTTFFSYFFERVRQQTQKMLQKSHRHSRIQRDIAFALGGETEIKSVLDRILGIVM